MIYSEENIAIAVSVLQDMYCPIHNVSIEELADAILWDFDEDYREHEGDGHFQNGVLVKEKFANWLSAEMDFRKKEYGIDYLSFVEEGLYNNS